MIGDALYAHLVAAPAVAAIVGDRIFPVPAPDTAAYPLIQYQQVVGRRLPILDGPHDYKGPVIQIDSYAERTAGGSGHVRQAHLLAAAVEDAMEAFVGVIAGVEVKGCHLEGERELPEVDGSLTRVSQDYQIWWRRP